MLRRASSQQSLVDLCSGTPLDAGRSRKSGSKRRNSATRVKAHKVHVRIKSDRHSVRKLWNTKQVLVKVRVTVALGLKSLPFDSKGTGKIHGNKLALLDFLTALHGLGIVISKFIDASPGDSDLYSAVKFASASLALLPFLASRMCSGDRVKVVRGGLELGALSFAHSLLANYGSHNTEHAETSLLYALTVLGLPLMQLYAGRSSKVTWLALVAALSGMGVLEEEGTGWKGIFPPAFGNSWSVVETGLSIIQMLRSEALVKSCDPVELNASQLVVLSSLNLISELLDHSHFTSLTDVVNDARGLPWLPLAFYGGVCLGVGSLLEARGLHGVDDSSIAISHLMVPVWAAFFTLLQQARTSKDIAVLSVLVLMFSGLCRRLSFMQNQGVSQQIDKRTKRMMMLSHFPVVILSSQLKHAFYANQAQALLADMNSTFDVTLDACFREFLAAEGNG